MFAAKMRDSVLTLPLLHTASCAMQKNIAGFEALKQLENPNAWCQVKVTVAQPIYATCVANPSSSPTAWWISDITCLGFIWIQQRFRSLRQLLHVLSMCASTIPCFSFQPVPHAAGTYPKRAYTRHAVQCVLLYLSYAGYGTSLTTGFSLSSLAANSRTESVENTWRWRPQSYTQSFGIANW